MGGNAQRGYTAALWDGEVPGFEQAIGQRRPSITFFPAPGDGKRGCVIVMAGGSYTSKAVHEGKVVAQKINEAGIHAAVLDYRVVPYSRDIILLDAKRAVRYLRYHAEEMSILPDKIGVLGFSAVAISPSSPALMRTTATLPRLIR